MSLVLGIILGLIALFFMKNIALFGAVIAGLIAGAVAKGPIAGIFAGFSVLIIGSILFSASSFAAESIIGSTDITGFAIKDIEPISFLKSIFGVTGVLAGTVAGLVGGLIRR